MRGRASLVGAALFAAACSSAPDVKPSPLPPGYVESAASAKKAPSATANQGKSLNEVLAWVEGKPMTRRRLIRETGGRPKDMDDDQMERLVHDRLKEWAREELFVHAATRAGLHLPEQALDAFLKDQTARMEEEASKSEGRPVKIDEILRDRGITAEEFREKVRREALAAVYFQRIREGISGARPQVDMEVSPAEIRRIYREHPGEFDIKRGVRLAIYEFQLAYYQKGGTRSFEDAEADAHKEADALVAAFQRGEDPKAIGERFFGSDHEKGIWNVLPEARDEGDPRLLQLFGEKANAWLFDPARRDHDARIQRDLRGPRVLGIIEVRPAKKRDWAETSDEIVKRVQLARRIRIEENLVLELLSGRSVVLPQALADEMIDDARHRLDQISKDPTLGPARFQ